MKLLWTLIGTGMVALGSAAAIAAAAAKWTSQHIAERLHLPWQHNYDRQLEESRSQLAAKQNLLTAIMGVSSAGYLAAQERRLKAVAELWAVILRIRESVSKFSLAYSVLVPEEYPQAFTDVSAELMSLSADQFAPDFSKMSSIEQHRPFLGERLWVPVWVS